MTLDYQTETAMVLWEAILEAQRDDAAERPWSSIREDEGTMTFRMTVANFADAANADWAEVSDDYVLAWDWDFIPRWLLERVDWTDATVRTDNRDEWLAAIRDNE